MLLADEVADRAGAAGDRMGAVAEVQQRVAGAAVAHLVVEADEGDVVAGPVGQEFRHDEQRDSLDTGTAAGSLREDEVDDVVGEFVLAAGDPHLGAADPVGAVADGQRLGGDVGQRGTGLWLRQAHRAGEVPAQHGADPGVDLLRRSVRGEQVGIGGGE